MHHPPDTLHARKRRKARALVVAAAFHLFAGHCFVNGTFSSIALRADVGRTTYFQFFGDKHQVLFADESTNVERMCQCVRDKAPRPPGRDLGAAIELIKEAGATTGIQTSLPLAHSTVLIRLLRESTELRSRYLLTRQQRAG